MGKFDLYVGRSVLFATLGVLVLLVGLDALTSVVDETDDIRDGYGFVDILIYVAYTLPRRYSMSAWIYAVTTISFSAGREVVEEKMLE